MSYQPVVPVSASAQASAEVVKTNQTQIQQQTNQAPTEALKQMIHKTPYGPDGMLLSQKDQYNPFATVLPNAKLEKSRNYLKQKQRKKKDKEKKKKNFWAWLLSKED